MLDYPATLPLPNRTSYAGVVGTGALRTSIVTPLPSQVQTFNAPVTEISMTFSMVNNTYISWSSWTTNNAYQWFRMPVVSGSEPDDILSVRQVRFSSDVSYTKQGDNWLSVTVMAELLQAEPFSRNALVDAGGPYSGIINTPIQLDATVIPGEDPNPDLLWTYVGSGGATGSFSSTTIEDPTFTADSPAVFTLTLTATSTLPGGGSSSDNATLTATLLQTYLILTEAGDNTVTEAGDTIITEEAI